MPWKVLAALVIGVLLYGIIGSVLSRREGESYEITAERAGQRIEGAFRGIFTTTRVAFFTGFSVLIIALEEGAMFVTMVGDWLANAPMVVSNIVGVGLAYLTLDGWLAIGAEEFAILAFVTLILGVIVSKS